MLYSFEMASSKKWCGHLTYMYTLATQAGCTTSMNNFVATRNTEDADECGSCGS